MNIESRHEEILGLLRMQERVLVEDLATRFDVSTQTIRSDLRDLAEAGLVARTRGGARRLNQAANRDYTDRRKQNAAEKEAIGALAASLIPHNCSVTLNIGTTTEQVARALSEHKDLVVLSNNINIINALMGAPSKELILVGGAVRQTDGAIVGEDAVEFISRYKVDYAVIGTSALDADGAVLDYDAREVSVARAILRNSRTRILVTDASKFDRTAPVRICGLPDLDYVVTDRQPPFEFLKAARAAGTEILTLDGGDDV
ncbi:DeoR/GlpR family DNA-binding transcription regulator [Thalassococcus sp. S3]|uniref:DeoR/GlpR family DNA-binding transcription regulator n=1 Tax=Thalassococcus sp. S3 TaxID=2017482 RepID=UPI00210FA2A1|nr:DeoR/GlpR family DNA-binding transcription regulator [Thalassococcus sp. S3]